MLSFKHFYICYGNIFRLFSDNLILLKVGGSNYKVIKDIRGESQAAMREIERKVKSTMGHN